MVIRVMQEVKAREEEYTMIKTLSARLRGLPLDFHLASRDRRLIAQGPLLRVFLSDDDHDQINGHLPEIDYMPLPTRTPYQSKGTGVIFPVARSLHPSTYPNRANPGSIPRPILRHDRVDSATTESSLAPSDAPTFSNETSDSSVELQTPAAGSITSSFRSGEVANSYFPSQKKPSPYYQNTPNAKPIEIWIHAFIFTDVVVLATPASQSQQSHSLDKDTQEAWDVIEGIGLARVLGVTDLSEKLS